MNVSLSKRGYDAYSRAMTSVTQRLRRAGTSRGLRHALKVVQLEWALNRRHRRSARILCKSIAGKSELLLHLGCGPNLRPDWINIDLFAPNADAQLDLREDWPFSSGSASRVYSEHVFEHFEYPIEVRHFLGETLRVLKPGGAMDVGVPDTEWPLTAYGDASDEYWRLAKEVWHPPYCETQLDHINYHFRQAGEHKYAWDALTLTNELQKAGFVSIERRVFDPSLDSESRRLGTLYMRARKST
jgi:predicted SAM-dependent methyltransferase